MAKLIGKAVGQTIVEFLGPIEGTNYNVQLSAFPITPQLFVQVFGTGAVRVEETPTFQLVGNDGPNVFTREKQADPLSWASIGPATIDQSLGLTPILPSIHPNWTAIRIVVDVVGEGQVVISTDWK